MSSKCKDQMLALHEAKGREPVRTIDHTAKHAVETTSGLAV
jgi:hypothetical protein